MPKQRSSRRKKGRTELRLTRTEKIVLVGSALVALLLLALFTPWNARRAVEHARAHAGRAAGTAAVKPGPQKGKSP